ncbi:MAG: DNA polymerase III subunit gamma/tau [Clostridia bacterium]|nr:DNA polymerase III subunit gamma/tau [Clostridia bacterium]
MAYLALYRKYRPKSFDEVIGQEHITRTLVNQIRNGRIGHAYLFTGTRGIGKTTVARILARAVNCQSPDGKLPCGRCEVCKTLEAGNIDIVELDGASNNRVDEVRELRESVAYPATIGKYKVYIIDEVHMLTGSAFNALLKTVEEPPEYVIFILCTTEAHKIPQTILSRCMRFDFRLVSVADLEKLIVKLLADVGKEADDTAVHLIASLAEGSVRDALSNLDRCLLISEGRLKYEDALLALGATDIRTIYGLGRAILTGDAVKVVKEAEELKSIGKNFSTLSRELAAYFRNLALVHLDKNANIVLQLPSEHFSILQEDAKLADTQKNLDCAELFGKAEGELRYSISPSVTFETAALKACLGYSQADVFSLEKRVKYLEKAVGEGVKKNLIEADRPQTIATKDDREVEYDAVSLWSKVLKSVKQDGGLIYETLKEINDVSFIRGVLTLSCGQVAYTMLSTGDNNTRLINAVNEYTKAKVELVCVSAVDKKADSMKKLEVLAEGKLTVI